eukprot:gene275-370_t
MPILTGALATGWGDIRTVFRQKSTGKRRRPPGKEIRPEIASAMLATNMNAAFSSGLLREPITGSGVALAALEAGNTKKPEPWNKALENSRLSLLPNRLSGGYQWRVRDLPGRGRKSMSIRSRLFATVALPVLSVSLAVQPALADSLMKPFEVAQEGSGQPSEEELLLQQRQAEEQQRAAEEQ